MIIILIYFHKNKQTTMRTFTIILQNEQEGIIATLRDSSNKVLNSSLTKGYLATTEVLKNQIFTEIVKRKQNIL